MPTASFADCLMSGALTRIMRFFRMRRDSGLRRFELFKPAPRQTLETEIETVDGQRLPLRLVVHPRARRVSLRVCPVKRVAIATAPSQRLLKQAAQFAAERAGWIAHELARL